MKRLALPNKNCLTCGAEFGRDSCGRVSDYKVEGLKCLHKCDNTKCVNPEHLFVGTHDDNMKDMASKHRGTVGEKCVHSKLTANKVMEIKFALKRGNLSRKNLADIFAVSVTAIRDIYNNSTWKHLL